VSYEQELTFELRMRGRSETEIADILRELRGRGSDDVALREEFGPPGEYAAEFESRKRKTIGGRIVGASTLLGLGWIVACVVVSVVRRFVFGVDPATEGVIQTSHMIVGALTIVLVGLAGGFLFDYLRPSETGSGAQFD
jgi:uncharacterized membrane-anchored protein